MSKKIDTKSISYRMDKESVEQFEEFCSKHGVTVSWVNRKLVTKFLKENPSIEALIKY